MVRFLLFNITLLIFTACGVKGKDFLVLGLTSKKELQAQLGEPLKTELTPQTKKEILTYENEIKYQVDNEVVVAKFRNPKNENEKSFIFWRHQFRGKKTTLRNVPSTLKTDLKPEQEYICLEEGITIIYDPNSDQVVRIYEYEKKK